MAPARLLLACAGLAVAFAAPAAAAPGPPQLPPQAKASNGMIVVEGAVPDKAAKLAEIDAYVDAILAPEMKRHADEARDEGGKHYPRVTSLRRPLIHGSSKLTGYNSKNYSCSYMYARFTDSVSHPFFETSATIDGSSRTAWLGSCPYNAASVKLADTICFDTVGFSVSVGGAGFSSSGGGCASWSGSVSNNWQITHYYSGVKGSCGCAIWRVRQTSGGTYKFGTTFVTVNANGSLVI